MTTTKKLTTTATVFGAALSSLYAAPDLQADVVDLTFSTDAIAFSATANVILGTANGALDQIDIFGGSDSASSLSFFGNAPIVGVGIFSLSADIVGGEGGALGVGFTSAELDVSASADEIANSQAIIGFQTEDGNVGFFTVDLNFEGDSTITGGVFDNDGGPLVAGVTTAVPEPASGLALAALALGAAGVRRRRQTA